MAASNPKQRFNPRATLYSPPPSLTVNCRVVQIRYSPGSNRSITSPRVTKSQRQPSFCGTTIEDIVSSPTQPASVHRKNVSVHVVTRGGTQKNRSSCDVVGLP